MEKNLPKLSTFAEIIDLWPTTEEFSSEVGVTGNVGRAWKNRSNNIPSKYFLSVVEAANRRIDDMVEVENKQVFELITYQLLCEIAASGTPNPFVEGAAE